MCASARACACTCARACACVTRGARRAQDCIGFLFRRLVDTMEFFNRCAPSCVRRAATRAPRAGATARLRALPSHAPPRLVCPAIGLPTSWRASWARRAARGSTRGRTTSSTRRTRSCPPSTSSLWAPASLSLPWCAHCHPAALPPPATRRALSGPGGGLHVLSLLARALSLRFTRLPLSLSRPRSRSLADSGCVLLALAVLARARASIPVRLSVHSLWRRARVGHIVLPQDQRLLARGPLRRRVLRQSCFRPWVPCPYTLKPSAPYAQHSAPHTLHLRPCALQPKS